MNLSTLITETQRLGGRVDNEWQTRVRRFLHEAQKQWAIKAPWPTLRRTETFTTRAGREMILPQRVLTVEWIGDRTNKAQVGARDHWDREFPSSILGDTTGRAFFWRPQGVVPVTAQPTTTTTLAARTGASDVFNVYISGYRIDTTASGTPDYLYFDEESLAIVGSGPVIGTKQFLIIQSVGKDDFTPSDVVIYNGSDPIARIQAHEYRAEYRRIEFIHIPGAGVQMDIGYITAPEPLIETYQTPHPAVDPEFLIWYAAAMMHEAQGQLEQAQIKYARAEQIFNTRIYKETAHGDQDFRVIPEHGYWGDEDQYIWE